AGVRLRGVRAPGRARRGERRPRGRRPGARAGRAGGRLQAVRPQRGAGASGALVLRPVYFRRRVDAVVRITVLGGTRFIGPHVVRSLVERDHEVTVIHRGETEADLPAGVRHVHVDFAQFRAERARLAADSPDVVLDMVPFIDKGGHGVRHFQGVVRRAVVVTSCDVYRAFGRLWRTEPGPPD